MKTDTQRKRKPRRQAKPLKNLTAPRAEVFSNTIYSVECPRCNNISDLHSRPSHGVEYQCPQCDGMMTLDMSSV